MKQYQKRPTVSPVKIPDDQTTFERDYLFISYAWEDRALADWLYARLTSEGYKVWCDRYELLGGERFPHEIDVAIKQRTFRMIALLSRYSLSKPNPSKERKLALDLGRERNEGFMIPLNVDQLRDTELDWLASDVAYISFASWATGLGQLLKRLETLNAPRPLADSGKALSIARFLPTGVVVDKPETLYTNCFRFRSIPPTIYIGRKISEIPVPSDGSLLFPTYPIGETHLAAFEFGHAATDGLVCELTEVNWRETDGVFGILPRNIVSNLLRQTLELQWRRRGLVADPESRMNYFPIGLTPNDKIRYTTSSGRAVPVNSVGVRRFRNEQYRYHLAPAFRVRQDMGGDFVAQLRLRLHLTDLNGKRLDPTTALSRRKALTSNWFNHQWLSRYLAVAEFFADSQSVLQFGSTSGLEMEASAIVGEVPFAINDAMLEPLRDDVTPSYEEDADVDSAVEEV
ncbi:MAG TPA: toll/interleukin-1 receptor domain-containing protein [Bryobacteraceae bacterium]|nr:toll/interleukin-1 receptor domain-containing protein [Bryobacteraceae bacterium]